MRCAWERLLGILPGWLGTEADRVGRQELQELRLRLGQATELVLGRGSIWLDRIVSREDLNFVVNTASRYSPWSAVSTEQGYLTAAGGHRIGLCGDVIMKDGKMCGIRQIHSLNIRVARDITGIAGSAAAANGSVLLIGPPGSGKSTLLRDLAREIARRETVCVVDERGELFPEGISRGRRMDVMYGCSKKEGIDILLRTMTPDCIVMDEITSEADCEALVRAGWCGVRILATAHAATVADLKSREVYRQLVEKRLFDHVLVLDRDKSWREERVAV